MRADECAEREGEHGVGEADPLQQRRERRDQQDGAGEQCQYQVDVHACPSAVRRATAPGGSRPPFTVTLLTALRHALGFGDVVATGPWIRTA